MKLRNKVVIICSMFLIILSLAILLFSCIFYKKKMDELKTRENELKQEVITTEELEEMIKEY